MDQRINKTVTWKWNMMPVLNKQVDSTSMEGVAMDVPPNKGLAQSAGMDIGATSSEVHGNC